MTRNNTSRHLLSQTCINHFSATDNYQIELSNFNTVGKGILIKGSKRDDWSGHVNNIGDFNGDGYDDVIIGAWAADPNGKRNAGESYIVFGNAYELTEIDLENFYTLGQGILIQGIDVDDQSGAVSSAGDFNGDGYDDVIIGAQLADPNGQSNAGESYIVFGNNNKDRTVIQLSDLENHNQGILIKGINKDDWAGRRVTSAGDFNGDGFDDVIIAAHNADPNGQSNAGESYIVFGTNNANVKIIELSSFNVNGQGILIKGDDRDDWSGISLSSAGDFNGDGLSDIIIGSNGADLKSQTNFGNIYIIFGTKNPNIRVIELSSFYLNGLGILIKGANANDEAGWSVASAGDFNGDGYSDVVIGARFADSPWLSNSGNSYILFGFDDPQITVVNLAAMRSGCQGILIRGANPGDESGAAVAGAGDFNDDGYDDVIIGAWAVDLYGQSNAGASYIIFGTRNPLVRVIDLNSYLFNGQGVIIKGIDKDDQSGGSVSSAGDFNGDGIVDVIIGANKADPDGRSAAGESYIIYGTRIYNFQDPLMSSPSPFSSSSPSPSRSPSGSSSRTASFTPSSSITHSSSKSLTPSLTPSSSVTLTPSKSLTASRTPTSTPGPLVPSVINYCFQLHHTINIKDLKQENKGIVIHGKNQGDHAGISVASIGDINNDGFDDVIIGAYTADPKGKQSAGESYIIYGNNNVPLEIDLLNLGKTGVVIEGLNSDDWSGFSVAGGGDFNSDGYNDIIISAIKANVNDLEDAGIVYVLYGSRENQFSLENSLLITGGGTGDQAGWSVANAGDFNGDGKDDILIGAPEADPFDKASAGITYVIFGSDDNNFSEISLRNFVNSGKGIAITGINAGDRCGKSVSGIGDFNGDGFDDILIGAHAADVDNKVNVGEAYIIFGGIYAAGLQINLAQISNLNLGIVIKGIKPYEWLGKSVASLGDINRDGLKDIIIGAYGTSSNDNENSGAAYLIFGTKENINEIDLANLGFRGITIKGSNTNDLSGYSVSGIGDFNGDGFRDFIVGAPEADTATSSAVGKSYIIFGRDNLPATIDLANFNYQGLGLAIEGAGAGHNFGWSVASAGDFNGDGYQEVIIGAWAANPYGRSDAGSTYIIYGHQDYSIYPLDPSPFSSSSPSPSRSPSGSSSKSLTPSLTPSSSVTLSPSKSLTANPTPSASPTKTSSPTISSSLSHTPTKSISPSHEICNEVESTKAINQNKHLQQILEFIGLEVNSTFDSVSQNLKNFCFEHINQNKSSPIPSVTPTPIPNSAYESNDEDWSFEVINFVAGLVSGLGVSLLTFIVSYCVCKARCASNGDDLVHPVSSSYACASAAISSATFVSDDHPANSASAPPEHLAETLGNLPNVEQPT